MFDLYICIYIYVRIVHILKSNDQYTKAAKVVALFFIIEMDVRLGNWLGDYAKYCKRGFARALEVNRTYKQLLQGLESLPLHGRNDPKSKKCFQSS